MQAEHDLAAAREAGTTVWLLAFQAQTEAEQVMLYRVWWRINQWRSELEAGR